MYVSDCIHCPVSLQNLDENLRYLVGDCLVAAAFLSYAGPFLSTYRDELVTNTWLKQVAINKHIICLLKLIPLISHFLHLV